MPNLKLTVEVAQWPGRMFVRLDGWVVLGSEPKMVEYRDPV